MKKAIVMVLSLVSGIFLLAACEIAPDVVYNDGDSRKYISKLINIELPKGVIIEDEDTHGGNGDGTYFSKVTVPEAETETVLSLIKASFWQELPLREDVDHRMYGDKINEEDYYFSLAGKVGFPVIENGYWYFYDRSPERKQNKDSLKMYSNFILSIFDTDSKILYVYKYDS